MLLVTILLCVVGLVAIWVATVGGIEKTGSRMFLGLVGIVIFSCSIAGYIVERGIYGRPFSLSYSAYYHVLSVTQLDEKSTVVILRDASGITVPIEFYTQIKADTNGFYILVGDDASNYNLAPIK